MSELAQGKEVAVSASPSIFYNNLCTLGDSYGFAHQTDLYLSRPLGCHKFALKEKDRAHITSICGAKFQNRELVVVVTNQDTQIWDAHKEVELAVVSHSAEEESRGVAALDCGSMLVVALGHSTGELEFISIGTDFNAQVLNRQKAHKTAVTCVATSATSACTYASGDTSGELQFWNNNMQAFGSVPVQKDSVSAISIVHGWVAVAYGSGTIRLYNAQTCQIRFDIGAHSRWINAMAFHPQANLLATVAEDNLVCIFRLIPSETAPKAEFVGYRVHPNRLPTGVAFSEDGKTVMVALYDSDKLLSYAV